MPLSSQHMMVWQPVVPPCGSTWQTLIALGLRDASQQLHANLLPHAESLMHCPTPHQNASPDPPQDYNLGLVAGSVDTTSQNHETHAQQYSPARNHTRAKPGEHAKGKRGETHAASTRTRNNALTARNRQQPLTGTSKARRARGPAQNGWAGGDWRPQSRQRDVTNRISTTAQIAARASEAGTDRPAATGKKRKKDLRPLPGVC